MAATRARLTILFSQRHDRHVIIRRQIGTFLKAGYAVTVVDQSDANNSAAEEPYRYSKAWRLEWVFATKTAWRIVRRVPSRWAHERFWAADLWLRLFSNALSIAVVALRDNPDCYLAEDLQSAWAAVLASWVRSHPVVFCAHELESEQGRGDEIRRRVLRSLQRWVIPRVSCLVVPNAARAAVFERDFGARTKPLVVLNCPPRMNVNRGNVLHERLSLATSTRIVLYHGALIPFRALDKLVQSAAHFPPKVVLVLIGEQGKYYRNVLAPHVEADDLRGKVYVLPFVTPDQVAPFVASADLGIVIYENVNLNNYLCAPTKLYEYLSQQVPIAACNFPEICRLLDAYAVGVTFDPADVESIAGAVRRFFAMSASELVDLQRDLVRAREEFTWEGEEQKWLELLGTIIPPGRRLATRRAVSTP